MCRMGTFCCARTASGRKAAALPRSVTNSRRLICLPLVRNRHRSGSNWQVGSGQVGAGQRPPWVKSEHCAVSGRCPALPPKADITERRRH